LADSEPTSSEPAEIRATDFLRIIFCAWPHEASQ
jgi:hypothetical protein